MSQLQSANADVVLLDINLGLQQGGAFLNLAWEQGFNGKVLVVTAGVSKIEAARLMERGCSGIILKHERPQLLVERIREVMQETAEQSPRRACRFGAIRSFGPGECAAFYAARAPDSARCFLRKIEQRNGARFEYFRVAGQSRAAAVIREDRSAHAFPVGPDRHRAALEGTGRRLPHSKGAADGYSRPPR